MWKSTRSKTKSESELSKSESELSWLLICSDPSCWNWHPPLLFTMFSLKAIGGHKPHYWCLVEFGFDLFSIEGKTTTICSRKVREILDPLHPLTNGRWGHGDKKEILPNFFAISDHSENIFWPASKQCNMGGGSWCQKKVIQPIFSPFQTISWRNFFGQNWRRRTRNSCGQTDQSKVT